MLQNATPLRKSAPMPGPPSNSDEHVSCTAPATENASFQILFKCPTPVTVFAHATKPSRFAHFWQGAQSLAPATQKTTSERPKVLRAHQFFPTCQVRVVRFCYSCSPPPPPRPHPPTPSSPPPSPPASPPPPLHPLPCSLPPCQLFAKLFANFRTQWALLDLNCKGLSALGTSGPQPGTFRAQWAPLDLNMGPSELSAHRWTSTAR